MNTALVLTLISLLLLLSNLILLFRWKKHKAALKEKDEKYSLLEQDQAETLEISEIVLELNAVIRAAGPDIQSFLDASLSAIASRLQANCGCIFIADNEQLHLKSVYAFDTERDKTPLKIGDSLAGSAFLEEKPYTVKDLPENYLRLSSGIGYGQPAELLFIPLVFNGEKPGVIELASFGHFNQIALSVAEKISEPLAAKLITMNREEIRRSLLRESQERAKALADKEKALEQSLRDVKLLQEKEEQTRILGEQRLRIQIAEQEEVMKKTLQKFELRERELREKIKSLNGSED